MSFDFVKDERRVGVYYFYILDPEFGPGFIKICTYFPYPAKVWLNGHEWAKRQAAARDLGFTALANGFATCDGPERAPGHLRPLRARATSRRSLTAGHGSIPTPLTAADRAAGYWWELSMRQVEVSRTLVFDDPRRARGFFEALVADNIGIGRPEEVAMVVRPPGAHQATKEPFRDPGLHHRHRGHDRLPLQALPRQAVPERREGAADRNGHQQTRRPRRPRPPRAPARAGRQGPRRSTIVCL